MLIARLVLLSAIILSSEVFASQENTEKTEEKSGSQTELNYKQKALKVVKMLILYDYTPKAAFVEDFFEYLEELAKDDQPKKIELVDLPKKAEIPAKNGKLDVATKEESPPPLPLPKIDPNIILPEVDLPDAEMAKNPAESHKEISDAEPIPMPKITLPEEDHFASKENATKDNAEAKAPEGIDMPAMPKITLPEEDHLAIKENAPESKAPEAIEVNPANEAKIDENLSGNMSKEQSDLAKGNEVVPSNLEQNKKLEEPSQELAEPNALEQNQNQELTKVTPPEIEVTKLEQKDERTEDLLAKNDEAKQEKELESNKEIEKGAVKTGEIKIEQEASAAQISKDEIKEAAKTDEKSMLEMADKEIMISQGVDKSEAAKIIESRKEKTREQIEKEELEEKQRQDFIQDELTMFLLPRDEVVLGNVTYSGMLSYATDYDYFKEFWDYFYSLKDKQKREQIEKYLISIKKPVLEIEDLEIAKKEAISSVSRSDISTLRVILNHTNYPLLDSSDDYDLVAEAVRKSEYNSLYYMIMRGANVNRFTNSGKPIIQEAEELSHPSIVWLLRKSGAR